MLLDSYQDALDHVMNSGIVDWEWEWPIEGLGEEISAALYDQAEEFDSLEDFLRVFIAGKGGNPSNYGL